MAAGGMLGVSVRRSKSKPLYHTLVVVSMGHILYMSTVGLAAGGRGERRKRAAQQASPRSLLHAGTAIKRYIRLLGNSKST